MNFYPQSSSELIAAINQANALGSGSIYLLANQEYVFTSADNDQNALPQITGDISIYGNGATFKRLSASYFRFFDVYNHAELSLYNLRLENGNVDSQVGGAIRVFGDYGEKITLQDCEFINNHAWLGGAIRYPFRSSVGDEAGSLVINRCLFQGNTASEGGAISTYDGITGDIVAIRHSQFIGNQADYAGAIYAESGGHELEIDNCLFQTNSATGEHGVLYSIGHPVRIRRASFIANSASGNNGVFYLDGSQNDIKIFASRFQNNQADWGGVGAINWADEVQFIDCEFKDNLATGTGNTGGLYLDGQSVELEYCEFSGQNNLALEKGSVTSIKAAFNYWGDPSGPSGAGSGSGDAIGTGIVYTPFIGVSSPTENLGKVACPCGFVGSDAPDYKNPISIRLAEKRLDETDMRLNTPLGELAFTRSYRQSQQASLDFMGLGWTHNHDIRLSEVGGSPNKIEVYMGGNTVVFYDDNADDTFEGAAGSASVIVKDTNGYLLTATDESVYEFDTNGVFLSRTLPNSEVWSYSYASSQLSEVSDGYGRKLKFAYYSGETGGNAFKNGLLKRVGSHTSSDLDNSPQSPYIELDYTDDGNGEGLLTSVQDVRGEVWTYRYYGSLPAETDTKWLNFLVERFSPSVDQDGDGSPDAAILLEALSYTGTSRTEITEINQARGDAALTNDFAFDSTNGVSSETTAGRTSNHYFTNGVYSGSANPADEGGSEMPISNYRPVIQEDARGNRVHMKWDETGRKLTEVMDANYQRTAFDYDGQDRLISSIDAEGRETEYSYGDSNVPRQPTLIRVLDGSTVLRRQEFAYDSKGRVLSEKLISPADETTVLQETTRVYGTTAAQNDYGLLVSITVKDLLDPSNDSSTVYTYDAQGRVIKTQKTSLFGTCEFNYSVYDAAGNVLGTACGLYNASPAPSDLTGLLALYDDLDATKKHTRITTHVYDEMGRRVQSTSNAAASFERSSRSIYDALGRVVRSIQNYVPQGSSAPGDWLWDAGDARWEDGAGTAISFGAGLDENLISDTVYNERGLVKLRRDVLGRVTLYGYDLADRLVKTIQNASDPDYNSSYATGDPDLSSYSPSSDPELDMISEQGYDPNGNLVWSKDARGAVTLTVYDALNRPVKVINNASQPAYDIWADPDLSAYGFYSTAPDQDIVSETEYDAMGRVVRSKRLLENRFEEIWDVMLYGYDALGRQIKSIQHASQPDYDLAADPDLSEYVLSEDADLDMLTETVYDVQGRVLETIDLNGRKTRMVYDGLNRQVKTIANYVAQGSSNPAAWEWANNQWEDGASNAIDHGTGLDENIISETIYDSDGRVEASRNVQGFLQRTAYDLAGRQALTVQNYVAQGSSDPVDWLWSSNQWQDGASNAIDRGTGFDQNLISQPEYDLENRVFQSRDARGNLSRQVFDDSGRVVMNIQNYVAQGSSEAEDWEWANNRWEDGANNAINHGSNQDQNRIQSSQYDLLGRVFRSRDALGRESYTVFDSVGRVRLRIQNYVPQGSSDPADWEWANNRWEDGANNAISHGSDFDQNLISETVYNQAGQVLASRDARGTLTGFVYDGAGRRLQVQQALGTPLETASYTCYDKAGRLLRQIANYIEVLDGENQVISPDAWDESGAWHFAPTEHGPENDINLISASVYDRASRRIQSLDPLGNVASMTYAKDGQVLSMSDPEGMVTVYRYDQLRRRTLVVQNYVANAEDPALWLWDAGDGRYEQSNGSAIAHGSNNDENIIVQVHYDIAGRTVGQREPRGHLNYYAYDRLARRTNMVMNYLPQATLPEAWVFESGVWKTGAGGSAIDHASNSQNLIRRSLYTEAAGATGTGLVDMKGNTTQRDFDRFGRMAQLDYGNPANTPTVSFAYDLGGKRLSMVENDGTSDIRITGYHYDAANRLKQVDFDSDGDTIVEESVSYAYDLAGLRSRLTMPGGLDVTYSYDAKGRLISLKDWDEQVSRFSYDRVNRHNSTQRHNGFRSRYRHDAAGRLKSLRHEDKRRDTLAEFRYLVDGRGNRTQALELTKGASVTTKVYAHSHNDVVYTGNWTNTGTQHETTQSDARLGLVFAGAANLKLNIGEGPDYSIFDLYLDGTFYTSMDAYASVAGSRQVALTIEGDAWHLLELRNRREQNLQSTAYKLAFLSLTVDTALEATKIDYLYDGLSRLLEADYDDGTTVYNYAYDVAGNMVNMNGAARTYNAVNQLVHDGSNALSYDANANLANDGTNAYTWDMANRLLQVGNTAYKYDGAGNRIQQTVSSVVTDYLNDVQPSLVKLLKQDDGMNVEHFIHAPRGVFAMNDGIDWNFYAQDGLGSVRAVVDDVAAVQNHMSYDPYGNPMASYGAGFGFTGEQADANGRLYLRARYYEPSLGVFGTLDPFEGMTCTPMSLNSYAYVEGNLPNMVDPTGALAEGNFCGISSIVLDWIFNSKTGFYQQIPDPSPTPRGSSCRVGDNLESIASFARQEANQEAGQLYPTAAAIALAEINYLSADNVVSRSRSSNYSSRTRYIDTTKSANILNIVSTYVEASCSSNFNLSQVVGETALDLDGMEEYIEALQYIAQNPTIMYEHSFQSDNLLPNVQGVITAPNQTGVKPGEDLPSNSRDSQGNVVGPFLGVVIRGIQKSVVVSNDFNPVPFEWNCPVNQNTVVSSDYNPNLDGGRNFAAGHSCKSCRANTRQWWWTRDYAIFEKLSNADFQQRFRDTGIGGWVASCDE